MKVSFDATHIVGKVEVTPELKQYYENLISLIVHSFLDEETIEHIDGIIIPKEFISAVLEYQRVHNDKNPSVTNNEFGRAYGKLLYNAEIDKYDVFIDEMLAAFILGDEVFDAWFNNLDDESLAEAKTKRAFSINILVHELAHVEFALRVPLPKQEKSLHGGYIRFVYELLNEYYACRRAASFSARTIADDDEKFILDLEGRIDKERWRYKQGYIDLNSFCKEFHELTEMALIRLVSVLGTYAAENKDYLPFPNTTLGKQAMHFGQSFGSLFSQILNKEEMMVTAFPTDAVDSYYQDLGVIISDTGKGLYYSIPD